MLSRLRNSVQLKSIRDGLGSEAAVRINGDRVTINAGAGNDMIRVRNAPQGGLYVDINGRSSFIPARLANNLVIQGGSGNDHIVVDPAVTKNITIEGGLGNDFIQGGSGNDTIRGGSGNDWIHGGSGNDRISGSWGNDTIRGGTGHDVINGGLGTDHSWGGAGNDRVLNSNWHDRGRIFW